MDEETKKLLDKIRKIGVFILLGAVLIMLIFTMLQMKDCASALSYLDEKGGPNYCKTCSIFINSSVIQPAFR